VRRAFGSPWLRVGAITGAIAGAADAGEVRIHLMAADHAGLQLCIDGDGEGAIPQILDAFGDIVRANGGRDRRFRIEHAQSIAAKDVDRVAGVNVIASVEPSRAAGAFRMLADKGVRLALGTGWAAAPLNPMLALYAAATGLPVDGRNEDGGAPRLPITIVEALTAYTSGSAFAEFQDEEKGTLARGKLADLVILSDDILSIPAAQIRSVHVLTTIVGGRVVHQRRP
jgi:predicted amidohydrolase YtcJ